MRARFQFLCGAIKSAVSTPTLFRIPGFNSYVVRLKAAINEANNRTDYLFQFLCGAIKRYPASLKAAVTACFNSYVVRLKVDDEMGGKNKKEVSIPMWCD